MKTAATVNHPEIEWDDLQAELLSKDPEEREKVYVAKGTGSDGRQYSAIAIYSCDDLDKIEDIQLVD